MKRKLAPKLEGPLPVAPLRCLRGRACKELSSWIVGPGQAYLRIGTAGKVTAFFGRPYSWLASCVLRMTWKAGTEVSSQSERTGWGRELGRGGLAPALVTSLPPLDGASTAPPCGRVLECRAMVVQRRSLRQSPESARARAGGGREGGLGAGAGAVLAAI